MIQTYNQLPAPKRTVKIIVTIRYRNRLGGDATAFGHRHRCNDACWQESYDRDPFKAAVFTFPW